MTFNLDLSPLIPKIQQPEILQHPQIPAPLSGLNPRTLLSEDWWDSTRHEAYARNNYHCMACAGAPDDDPFGSTLEAHECYDILWGEALARYIETVALCWSCHNFIHAGRLCALCEAGRHDVDRNTVVYVLKHGMAVLDQAKLLPYWRTYVLARVYLDGVWEVDATREAQSKGIVDPLDALRKPDYMWRLEINGTIYRPK